MVAEAERVDAESMLPHVLQRRQREPAPRRQRVTPRFSDGEHELVCGSGRAGMVVDAWVAEVAVRVARSGWRRCRQTGGRCWPS